jgi:geranylgeranyl reductase family protein
MSHVHVLIVGGGPAGAGAAATLARAGVDCFLIDKATFPREKLCGGLVTGRCLTLIKNVFGLEYDPEILGSSSDINLMLNGETLSRITDFTTMHFTMRHDFDHWLLNRAIELGAKTRLGVGITGIGENAVTLTDGTTITFDILIGCDGVNSSVAKYLFGQSFNPKTIGFGLEVEAPLTKNQSVEIDFNGAAWGYAWAFPKHNSVTIGVGGIHAKNPDLKQRLSDFLIAHDIDPSTVKVKGQYIPFGDYRRAPGRGHIIVCGDAAGLVDPITGEGIGYAIQSGACAARAVMKQGHPHQTAVIYQNEIALIHNDLKRANFWRYLIFPKMMKPIFKRFFGGTGTLSRGFLDVMDGTRDYSELGSLLWQRVFNR